MGPHLSTLQYCNTPVDISDFARNLSSFTWQDEYRSAGVLNAVVDKGHLVQDPKVVELVGKFFAGFAGDEHGSKLASTPAVYALIIQHCFKYATTPDSVAELGRAMTNLAGSSKEGRALLSTAETVVAINTALTTYATTETSVEKLGSAITNICGKDNAKGKKLFCTPAIATSVNNALNKYADTTDSFKSLCNVIKTLSTDYKPGQKLFSNEDCAALVNNLLARNAADPERILELMRAVAAITKDNDAGQRTFFTPAMGFAVAKTFDRATTVVHIEQLSDAVREVVFLNEGVTETLFMTQSLVSAFSRVLMTVSVLNENRSQNNSNNDNENENDKKVEEKKEEAPRARLFSWETPARVTSLAVTKPLHKLLEANPIGIKAFAASNEFLDELRRIEDFSSASDAEAISSVRRLRLLLLTESWGGSFVASCFTDPGPYCEYCWCRVLDMDGVGSQDYPCNNCCSISMLLWFSMTLLPPVCCMQCEAFMVRGALKKKYNIKENPLCMVCAFLMPCNAMAQHIHEWKRRGEAVHQGCCSDPSTQVDPNDPVLVANNGPVRPRPKVQVMGEQQEQARAAAAASAKQPIPSSLPHSVNGNDDDAAYYNGDVEMINRDPSCGNYNNNNNNNSSAPNPISAQDDRAIIRTLRQELAQRQNGAAAASTYDNRNAPSNDEAQQAAALSHAYPPEACFLRDVPNYLTFNESVSALFSLRELPTDENGALARPDLQNWIPTNADVDRVVRFIDRQLPGVKNRPAVQQLISKSNLADDDIRALILMKMAHPFPVSKFLNAWLAGQRRDNKIAQTAGPIFTRIYRAMEKLPKIKRAATRGVIVGQIPALRATFDNYRTRCAPGKTMSFWGFSSFALENSVGSTYFTGSLNQESIIYKADVEGVDMEPFKPDGMPDEAEILPFCPAVFEIVSAEKAGAKLIIKLKQLKHEEFSYVEPMNGH